MIGGTYFMENNNKEKEFRVRKYKKKRQARRLKIMVIILSVQTLFLASMALIFLWKIGNTDTPFNIATLTDQNAESNRTKDKNINVSSIKNSNSYYSGESKDNDWKLILVNPWNKVPDNYDISLIQLINGQAIDERCYPELQQMMDDCRAAGLSPKICSSYRTQEKQERLFNDKVNRLIGEGYSQEAAQTEAATTVAIPGTSEHQLGLAVDIVDTNYQKLDSAQESTEVQQWLMENSWKYGFILRYPSGKSDITGIIYEPWHYRYVGKEAAKEIYEQGICLEEYLNSLV